MNRELPADLGRVPAVDALRGFVMARLIIGGPLLAAIHTLPAGTLPDLVVSQFYHSDWHGITWVDFSFAGYVMLMGLSVRLSLKRFQNGSLYIYLKKVVVRSLLLFALGFFYNGGFATSWPDVRLCGVLQRMAVCYLCAALVYRWTTIQGRAILFCLILLMYWALLAYVPIPGGTAGSFTFHGNLVAWVDSKLMPGQLLYGTWDPEGLLSTIPAIGSAIFGLLWGDLLLGNQTDERKAILLIFIGFVTLNLGAAVDELMPINKSMWTPSFVLVTAGIGSLLLGVFHFSTAVKGWTQLFFPCTVIGRNLLVAFILINVVPFKSLALRFTGGDAAILFGAAAPFVTAAVQVLLLWAVLLFLYQHKLMLRI